MNAYSSTDEGRGTIKDTKILVTGDSMIRTDRAIGHIDYVHRTLCLLGAQVWHIEDWRESLLGGGWVCPAVMVHTNDRGRG